MGFALNFLRLFYLKKSTQYLIIDSLLKKKYTTVDDLATDLYLSSPHIYRQINKLKKLFAEFHIQLDFNSHTETNLISEEKHLRLFAYDFFWNSYKGIEWPFTNVNKNLIRKEINSYSISEKETSEELRFQYLFSIIYIRGIIRGKCISLNKEMDQIIDSFMSVNNLSQSFENTLLYSKIPYQRLDINAEKRFLNFTLRMAIFDLDNDEQKRKIVSNLLTLDNPIMNYTNLFVTDLIQSFQLNLTPTERVYYLYYFTLLFMFIYYFDTDTQAFNEKKLQKSFFNTKNHGKIGNDIINFHTNFSKKHPRIRKKIIKKKFNQTFYNVIYFILYSHLSRPIKVYLQFSRTILGKIFIKKQLTSFFSKDQLILTSDTGQADIIISNSYEPFHKGVNFYYIDDFSDPCKWEDLISFIQRFIFNHNS
ncbi:helix-turn-helix domain-containing protein [Bacillus pseudomycoides]|uniref:Helix-turn-helix domain-containing protein n=1 Tax=Bacillus bingmayongensis TaxID=1150157 RepID=A0ABU5JSH8_9BACI|nr:helix-turn-helix domain-containing protein [Bacillus pseudomycoides]